MGRPVCLITSAGPDISAWFSSEVVVGLLSSGDLPAVFLQEKISFFFLKKYWGTHCQGRRLRASFFLQQKVSFFCWRNNKALLVWRAACMAHYFFKEEQAFVSEPIMRCLVFSWGNNEARVIRRRASVPHYFFRKKVCIFFWRNNEALGFVSRNREVLTSC